MILKINFGALLIIWRGERGGGALAETVFLKTAVLFGLENFCHPLDHSKLAEPKPIANFVIRISFLLANTYVFNLNLL